MDSHKNIKGKGSGIWQRWLLLAAFCMASGCALFPPQPPGCQGQFKPVNTPPGKNAEATTPSAAGSAENQLVEQDKTPNTNEGAGDGK